MKIGHARFNTYLTLTLAAFLAGGCATDDNTKKHVVLKLHLEINADGTERVGTATVGRSAPFIMSIEKKAFLTQLQIVNAQLLETQGGYSISLQFDHKGTWTLDQYSTANKGRHIAVWAEFGEVRWIAAPKITQRLSTGRFVFSPDVTREEAETIVDGINYVADQVKKGRL